MIEHLESIQEHFKAEYPREGCGVLAVVKGRMKWFPCTNIAKGGEDFLLDSTEYLKIKRTADIVGIVHNHPDASEEPSASDISHCNAVGLPYYIFSYPGMSLHVQEPASTKKLLVGREYKFGVADCFEAIRDYYSQELDMHIPARDPYEDDWWLKGLDYFNKEYVESMGFKKVDTPEVNDLLVFAVFSEVGNHCGVYLGNEVFFHHAVNRLSCRDHLQPLWAQNLIGVYRHVA